MEFRQSYIRESNDRLERLRNDIDRLSDLYEADKDNARVDLHDLIQSLRAKEQLLQSRLAELKDSTEDGWTLVKEGFETVGRELEEALEDAASKIPERGFRG